MIFSKVGEGFIFGWMFASLGTPLLASCYVTELGKSVDLHVCGSQLYKSSQPIDRTTLFESCLADATVFPWYTVLGPIAIFPSIMFVGVSTFGYISYRMAKFK